MQVLECVELTVHKFVRIQTPADFLTSVWEGVDGGYRTVYELGLHIYLSPQTVFWLCKPFVFESFFWRDQGFV